ncbi:unnamed protein product, partial [Polarella glacialis]
MPIEVTLRRQTPVLHGRRSPGRVRRGLRPEARGLDEGLLLLLVVSRGSSSCGSRRNPRSGTPSGAGPISLQAQAGNSRPGTPLAFRRKLKEDPAETRGSLRGALGLPRCRGATTPGSCDREAE